MKGFEEVDMKRLIIFGVPLSALAATAFGRLADAGVVAANVLFYAGAIV